MITYHPSDKKRLPSFLILTNVFLIMVVVLVSIYPTSEANGLQNIKRCIIRKRRIYVNKTIELGGRVLRCEGNVAIRICWGRCDSYEYGDYKLPYRVSHHPVCTYQKWKPRTVIPPGCDKNHPDPSAVVDDATACLCKECDSDTTSCENLKG